MNESNDDEKMSIEVESNDIKGVKVKLYSVSIYSNRPPTEVKMFQVLTNKVNRILRRELSNYEEVEMPASKLSCC